MVFNCTLCGMGPRATIVLVGLLSLIFSAAYVLCTTAGVLAHNCIIPMNNSIEEYAIYVYYLRNAECGKINLTNLGVANVPADFQIDVPDVSDAGHRTYILCIVGLVIYGLWFITSLFLLTSACVSCLGRCAIAFGIYPYIFVLFLVLAFDVVGLVFYMIDFVASFELDFVLDLLEIRNQDVVRPFFKDIDDIFLIVPPLIFWITASKGVIIWFIFFLLAFVMLGVGSRLWEENKPAPPYNSVSPRIAPAATAPVETVENTRTVAAVRYNDPARQPNDQLVFNEPPPPTTHAPMVVNNNNNVVRRTVEPLKVGYDQPPYLAEPPVYRSNEPPSPLRNTVLNPYVDKRFSYQPGNPQPFSYLAGPPQMSPRNSAANVPEVRGQLPWSYFPAAGGVEEHKRITSTLTESKDFGGQEIGTPTSKPGSEDRSSDEGKWSGPEYRDFKFYADRLIRLVIEESLNQLPYSDCSVVTPTGAIYDGLKYRSGNCGVSIVRSGEAMEQGLRDCCRSIRIGKILVESDAETHAARVVYARFPDDIARRQVLLMYPIMATGNTVIQAVNVLRDHGVPETAIILSNLFCTPVAARMVVSAFPDMKILTSELHSTAPNHFGQKYFGTD